MTDFIFLGSKITAGGDCSHEIKRHLLLGRKAMTNLDSILKNRDITSLTKIRIVKAMFCFSSHVWMWELDYKEDWAPKNWCFWTVVLGKTLESKQTARRQTVRWKARRSNQSTLKEINLQYSLEGLILWCRSSSTLATWCEEPSGRAAKQTWGGLSVAYAQKTVDHSFAFSQV